MSEDVESPIPGNVLVEALGRTDHLTVEQAAMIDEIPASLEAEGVDTKAQCFREPGGMGVRPRYHRTVRRWRRCRGRGVGGGSKAAV